MKSLRVCHVFPAVSHGDFTIVADVESHTVDFRCYDCVAMDDQSLPVYDIKDWKESGDWTTSLDEASIFLSGFIKWDGCANLTFEAQNHMMLHFCGRKDAARVGKLIDRLYELTSELLPTYDRDMAEGDGG